MLILSALMILKKDEITEGEPMKEVKISYTSRMPESLLTKIKIKAAKEKTTISAIINEAVINFLAK